MSKHRDRTTYDVYLSYAQQEIGWAAAVEEEFARAGLSVYNIAKTEPGEDVGASIWEALAESGAVVALMRDPDSKGNLLFEIGAAMAWEKPVYVLFKGDNAPALPRYAHLEAYPADELVRVVQLVKASARPLTDEQRSKLAKIY